MYFVYNDVIAVIVYIGLDIITPEYSSLNSWLRDMWKSIHVVNDKLIYSGGQNVYS